MFKHILVPLDGSPLAERALPHAEHFARVFGAELTLLQVLEPNARPGSQQAVDPLNWQIRKAEATLYLKETTERVLANLGGYGPPDGFRTQGQVNYVLREGKTAENIIDFAHSENIDLVVICTHGAGGLSRWGISSVAQKVIHLIFLPVLIVRAHQPPSIEDFKFPYRCILLPVDSSRRAEASLPTAIALAGESAPAQEPGPGSGEAALKARLLLTAILKPPEIPLLEPFVAEVGQLSEQLMQVSRQALSIYLNEMNERLPVESEIRVLESPDATAAIHQLAEQEDVDLVILCAHGYSGQVNLPYGSVARNYIEHGSRSVLIIQDVHRSQVRPGAVEIAAEQSGRR